MKPFIEPDCTITHDGKSFTAGGAVVTAEHLYAYPDECGILKDWHGNRLGTWRLISSRPAVFFGRHSGWHHTYYYMRATLDNGATYSLRGFGVGMIASGKRIKGE